MRKVSNVFKYVVLTGVTLIFIFPLIWVFYNSFKTNSELFENPWALPGSINFENYIYAWKQANIGQYFMNSIIVCVSALFLCLLLSTTAAFALTRLKWKLSNTAMMVFLVGMMIPIHSTLIPLFLMFSKAGIINSHLSLIIPYTTSGMPIAIFIMIFKELSNGDRRIRNHRRGEHENLISAHNDSHSKAVHRYGCYLYICFHVE